MIPKNWIHEDQLPEDLSSEDYDAWFALSRVIDGVRMGPRFPLPPIECIEAACRYCGARVIAQSDDPEPVCEACDGLHDDFLHISFEMEDQFIDLTGAGGE